MKMNKKLLLKSGDNILRVLDVKEDSILVIDCIKKNIPKWISILEIPDFEEIAEAQLLELTGMTMPDENSLDFESYRIMNERFNLVSDILPFIGDTHNRNKIITEKAKEQNSSRQTIVNYLCLFLVYQDKCVLAPKKNAMKKSLSDDEMNFRWALNKFFYTCHQNSLKMAYNLMLKKRYCNDAGKLLPKYPSFHQFRYYYRKHNKAQTYSISRHGIKSYQRNERPLLGNGVQEYTPNVGFGMLDSTICDIYLINEAGEIIGRPILTACIDAYSSLCCGYSLTLEGGMYSLRQMLINVVTNKKDWCEKFGIEIEEKDWNNDLLPATLITDRGTEYTSEVFEHLTELGIRVVNLTAFRPELKGPVERFFDLIQNSFKPILKGKGVVEKDYQNRGIGDYKKEACLTMADFEKVLLYCILRYNSKRVLKRFPYTEEMFADGVRPYANCIFEYGKSQAGANLLNIDQMTLMLTLLPRATGKFERNGLIVNKLRYKHSSDLQDTFFVECYLTGGEVTVAYDPNNVSYVWLIVDDDLWLTKNKFKNLDRPRYAKFVLIEARYSDKPLETVNELQLKQKKLIQAEEKASLQSEIDFINDITLIANKAQLNTKVNDSLTKEDD